MGKRKDTEQKAATPSASSEAAAPAAEASSPDAQMGLALIEAPAMQPSPPEPAGRTSKAETPPPVVAPSAMEVPKPAQMPESAEMPKPAEMAESAAGAAPANETSPSSPSSTEPPVAASEPATPPRSKRFVLLAASVAIAAAVGALSGALGASGIAWLASSPAPTDSPLTALNATLQDRISGLRSELASLQSKIDAESRRANAHIEKVAERIKHLDRAQAEPLAKLAKAVESLERRSAATKEVTGSVPSRPASPASASALPRNIIDGWVVRRVSRGAAFIQGRRFGVIEVIPGDVVPGLGQIQSIRRHQGRWIVVTSRGLITPPR